MEEQRRLKERQQLTDMKVQNSEATVHSNRGHLQRNLKSFLHFQETLQTFGTPDVRAADKPPAPRLKRIQ